MRGIGGRSQGADEHARKRIQWMRDRARTEGDAGFSGASRPGAWVAQMRGASGTGHSSILESA